METDGTICGSNLDDDDMENWLSVAAIEAELKPKVIETFDAIAGAYKQLRRLQDPGHSVPAQKVVALCGTGA
jgi:hypothetical protein